MFAYTGLTQAQMDELRKEVRIPLPVCEQWD